jgi:ferrochelatase
VEKFVSRLNQGAKGGETASQSVVVVLFQLGGPDSPEAVEPFLCNLFSDPDIIDFPFARLARPTLARLIASRRARRVREHYARIGGRSPIRELTERQAAALERELRKTMEARCFVAMRYWNPSTADAVQQIRAHRVDQLVLLPLYPQYSKTTTGSSLNEWRRQSSVTTASCSQARVIYEFHSHPLYIDAVVEKINLGLERFPYPTGLERLQSSPLPAGEGFIGECRHPMTPGPLPPGGEGVPRSGTGEGVRPNVTRRDPLPLAPEGPRADDVHLVFSAHGLPLKEIERGDPYQTQIENTVRSVMERGHWPNPHRLCYQSRLGPGKCLEPSLEASLREVAAQGGERVLVIPISFVTDHVETLYEIDIEARALAGKLGIRQFEVMPAMNDSPTFIRTLADLVNKAIAKGEVGVARRMASG